MNTLRRIWTAIKEAFTPQPGTQGILNVLFPIEKRQS